MGAGWELGYWSKHRQCWQCLNPPPWIEQLLSQHSSRMNPGCWTLSTWGELGSPSHREQETLAAYQDTQHYTLHGRVNAHTHTDTARIHPQRHRRMGMHPNTAKGTLTRLAYSFRGTQAQMCTSRRRGCNPYLNTWREDAGTRYLQRHRNTSKGIHTHS